MSVLKGWKLCDWETGVSMNDMRDGIAECVNKAVFRGVLDLVIPGKKKYSETGNDTAV